MHVIEAILTIKDNMSNTLKTVENNLGKFGKNLETKGQALRNFGGTVGYMGKDLLMLQAPLLAVGGWATKLGIDFEKATSEAQAIMGATKSEMDAFKDKAREVGGATSASAKESMEGIKLLGQAGLEQKEILELTYPLVRLSEAGNIDMARSADLLTNSMKSAEIPMKDVNQYLDQIALSGNLTNTSIEQQMEAWTSAGGSIKSANMKMSEANALFGILANRGVKGSEAGNAVSRVFQNLNATSGEAGKAMDKLKISTVNSDGSLRNKIDVLRELKEKTDSMTEGQREQILTMIGGKAHTESLKKMMAGLGDEYGEVEKKLQNSNGALETMANTMKDNLKGKLETLKSATEEFGLKLAEVLLPRVEAVVDKISGFVDKLNEMDESQINGIIDTVLFATKLALLLMLLGKGIGIVGSFMKNIGAVIRAFAKGGALANLFGVSGLKLVGIFGIIGGVIAIVVLNWEKLKPAIMGVVNAFKDFIGSSSGIIDSFRRIKDGIMQIFGGLGDILVGVLNIIEGILTGDMDKITEGFLNIFKGAVEVIKGVWDVLIGIIGAAIKIVINLFKVGIGIIKGAWNILKGILSVPIKAVVKLLSAIFERKVERVKRVWNFIKLLFTNPAEAKAQLLDYASKKIDSLKKKWESLKNFFKNPIQGTVKIAQKAGNWVKDKIGKNWSGSNFFSGGLTTLHEKGHEVYDLPRGTRIYPHSESLNMARDEGYKKGRGRSGGITIPKLADQIIVREDSDIDRIVDKLVSRLEDVDFNMA